MVFFEWRDELSVNIGQIDLQHKQLVRMLNDLYSAMQTGKGTAALGKILTGLTEYARTHFATEEKYMTQHNFPGFATHKAEHDAFVAKAQDLLARFEKTPRLLSVETGTFLKDWLNRHIMGTDKLYGPFLNDRGIK